MAQANRLLKAQIPKEHPRREILTNEIHARPPVPVRIPARISHLALLSGQKGEGLDRRHVAELCRRLSRPEPPDGANCWIMDCEDFRLSWERHVEFCTYTFFCQKPFTEPFQDFVTSEVPADWLQNMPGELMVAINMALEDRYARPQRPEELTRLFVSANIAGSIVSGGRAIVWSDFRMHGDGFSRFLIRDTNLDEGQAGRLVQRLLEIETYRVMALLAFPLTWEYSAHVSQADQALADLTQAMTQMVGQEDEHRLLDELSRLSAEIERIRAGTNYRFTAARAYYALVQRRIEELREERNEGRPTIKEFMDRRLAPAMRTCESLSDRLEDLSERVSRAADLLRTRVDVALEKQNRDLLASMDRRADLQLRLQETVEGLSVVVLSYYAVGLVGYALKSLKAAGVSINVDLLTGLAIPLVVGGVWLGIERFRRALSKEHGPHHQHRESKPR
jgi:uncharacterized membrane-anchored protein